MNERSYWREWPLAVFTIAVQVACGFAFAATALDWLRPEDAVIARNFGLAVFPTIAIGGLVSLLHLGRPLSCWRAFTNSRSSRLSQEIAATVLFGSSALVYAAVTYSSAHQAQLVCGSVMAGLGAIAVIANARVYHIPAQPGWRKAWSVVSLSAIAVTAAIVLPIFYLR